MCRRFFIVRQDMSHQNSEYQLREIPADVAYGIHQFGVPCGVTHADTDSWTFYFMNLSCDTHRLDHIAHALYEQLQMHENSSTEHSLIV